MWRSIGIAVRAESGAQAARKVVVLSDRGGRFRRREPRRIEFQQWLEW